MDDPRLKAAVDAALDHLEAQRIDAPADKTTKTPKLEPMSDGLFPPTPTERLDALSTFVRTERGYRVGMLMNHQDRRAYWQDRIDDADEALHHIEQLWKELA